MKCDRKSSKLSLFDPHVSKFQWNLVCWSDKTKLCYAKCTYNVPCRANHSWVFISNFLRIQQNSPPSVYLLTRRNAPCPMPHAIGQRAFNMMKWQYFSNLASRILSYSERNHHCIRIAHFHLWSPRNSYSADIALSRIDPSLAENRNMTALKWIIHNVQWTVIPKYLVRLPPTSWYPILHLHLLLLHSLFVGHSIYACTVHLFWYLYS